MRPARLPVMMPVDRLEAIMKPYGREASECRGWATSCSIARMCRGDRTRRSSIRATAEPARCSSACGEANCPFYRLTYLSNYSPDVGPDPRSYYSILAEISHSSFKSVHRGTVVDETIQGLVNTRIISECDREDIVDAFLIERDYTYPTPSLERSEALGTVQPWLEGQGIFSESRFVSPRMLSSIERLPRGVAFPNPDSPFPTDDVPLLPAGVRRLTG